jgi:hypothetical protein
VDTFAKVQENVSQISYLVNGGTDAHEWYQGGITYKDGQFSLSYEVWKGKNSINPSGGGYASVKFSKEVKQDHKIRIELSIGNKKVTLKATDLNNGAIATESFPTEGTTFKGGWEDGSPVGPTCVLTEAWAFSGFHNSELSTQRYIIIFPKNIENTKFGFERSTYIEENYFSPKDVPNRKQRFYFTPTLSLAGLSEASIEPELADPKIGNMRIRVIHSHSNEFYTEGSPER